MKNACGNILYIGKAKDLRKRVASYFGKEAKERYQIKFLMERVADIEFVRTDTEKEAILLEYKLIKQHRPKYNIDLKDGGTFVRIKISEHCYPSISVTRRIKKDGKYFGPYTSAGSCREMFDHAARFFRLRTCSDIEFSNRVRPCIQFDIGRCTAPCVGYVTEHKYAEAVAEAVMFLKGKKRVLLRDLKEKMRKQSESMNYEEAAHMRDLIKDIKVMLEKQKVVKPSEPENIGADIYNEIAENIRKKLKLKNVPHVIECADISNIQGKVASGSIVCFMDGMPLKSRYRLFNITRGEKPNDYAMMFEVLERRYKRDEWGLPDLLVIDGGRGQLSVACKVLNDLNIIDMPVVAIAKIDGSHKKSSDTAQVFLPNRVNPLKFGEGESALLYLIRIRDEAHRFGIRHYRKRHVNKTMGIF